jgi:hypothetical protein
MLHRWQIYGVLSLLIAVVVAGCSGIPAGAPAAVSPMPAATPTDVESTIDEPASEESTVAEIETALLLWEGYTEMVDGDATRCKSLVIFTGALAHTGDCGEAATSTSDAAPLNALHWDEILARFAPFALETAESKLLFNGEGTLAGEPWQRAIEQWAEFTYGETVTGRVSASARTVFSWPLDELAGEERECAHVVVLNYGYAYANIQSCTGGQLIRSSGGWLETAEMEQFDEWLYSRAPTFEGLYYLSAYGDQPISEEEWNEIDEWTRALFTRLDPEAGARLQVR